MIQKLVKNRLTTWFRNFMNLLKVKLRYGDKIIIQTLLVELILKPFSREPIS
jgi:hypothetical protein